MYALTRMDPSHKRTMKPQDLFNLAVRLLGLVFIYLAARAVANIIFAPSEIIPALLTAVFYSGIAWWLTGGAQVLAERAYPDVGGEPTETVTSKPSRGKADA
jgi:hypothetical protein